MRAHRLRQCCGLGLGASVAADNRLQLLGHVLARGACGRLHEAYRGEALQLFEAAALRLLGRLGRLVLPEAQPAGRRRLAAEARRRRRERRRRQRARGRAARAALLAAVGRAPRRKREPPPRADRARGSTTAVAAVALALALGQRRAWEQRGAFS